MSLSKVRSWVDGLPVAERNLPLVVVNSIAYTPQEILAEVEAGTELGAKLQSKVESSTYGTPQTILEALAETRLEKLLRERPVTIVRLVVPGEKPELTAEETIREVKERTELGRKLLEREIRYISHLRERYGS